MIWWFRIAGAACLLYLGWQAAQWRSRAIEADRLEKHVEALNARHDADMRLVKETEAARAEAEARELNAQEGARELRDDLINSSDHLDEPDCAFGPDSIGLLNRAGGYGAKDLPGGSGDPDGTGVGSGSAHTAAAIP